MNTKSTFNPNDHLIKLQGKDYLLVAWRIVWFRDANPTGSITTELISADTIIIVRAVVSVETGILSTGYGTAPAAGKGSWTGRAVEKAETAAIGRALAHAGYGTQFTDDEETDNLADSPLSKKNTNSARNTPPISAQAPASGAAPVIHTHTHNNASSAFTPVSVSGNAIDEVEGGNVDEASGVYQCFGVIAQPTRKTGGFMYVCKCAGGMNIAVFGGDKFREAGMNPDDWKKTPNKLVSFDPPFLITADLVGEDGNQKWVVHSVEVS